MLSVIESINTTVNNFIWGVPAMICIIGVGLYLSIRTGFLQIRKFPYAMKTTVGRMLRKREASDGSMTPFQAVCTALAATVGTGNIAGVAGAIAIGGPGAVFWMWISALLGMCTKFSEVTLAVHFRETNENGELVGGPMYYIKNGLKKHWHWLAYLFSAFGVLTVFGTGNATQVNTITAAVDSALVNYNLISSDSISTANLVMGIIIAALVALVLLGGIKRIGQVAEKLVPFMAVFYIILALGVVFLNFNRIPYVFSSIFKGAFTPASVTGGAVGSFFMSMKKGVSRGIFSNEAGLGTGSIAHACADTRKPVKQGFFGIFEVFTDTIVICTLTALTHHGSCGSCSHSMLTGSCLCDHTGFSHFLCQQYLTQHVIDLMCAGMVQIFSLQIHFCPAQILCHMRRIVQPGRSSRILIQKLCQLHVELRIIFIMIIGFFQFQNRIHQRLRNILSAVYSKSTF